MEVDIDRLQIASEEIASYSKDMEGLVDRLYSVKKHIWVPKYEWQAAIDARQSGTATSEQTKILDQGHWKE